MKFTVRSLLVLTLAIALIALAVQRRKEVRRLEAEIAMKTTYLGMLQKKLSRKNRTHVQHLIKIWEQALPDYENSLELHTAAKQRFVLLQRDGGEQ